MSMLFPHYHQQSIRQRIAHRAALDRIAKRRACPVPSPWPWMALVAGCLLVAWAVAEIFTR